MTLPRLMDWIPALTTAGVDSTGDNLPSSPSRSQTTSWFSKRKPRVNPSSSFTSWNNFNFYSITVYSRSPSEFTQKSSTQWTPTYQRSARNYKTVTETASSTENRKVRSLAESVSTMSEKSKIRPLSPNNEPRKEPYITRVSKDRSKQSTWTPLPFSVGTMKVGGLDWMPPITKPTSEIIPTFTIPVQQEIPLITEAPTADHLKRPQESSVPTRTPPKPYTTQLSGHSKNETPAPTPGTALEPPGEQRQRSDRFRDQVGVADVVLVCSNTGLAVVSLVLNGLVLRFYWDQLNKLIPFIYFSVSGSF